MKKITTTTAKEAATTIYVVGRCRWGCTVRLTVEAPGGLVPVMYCRYVGPGRATVEWYEQDTPIKEAISTLAWCLQHRMPLQGRPIRASYATSPCDDACTHATGLTCKCACEGANHGTEAW